MKLKATLGIKDCTGQKLRKYRIIDLDNTEIRDISVKNIVDAIQRTNISIDGLRLRDNGIIETNDIPKIVELRKGSISLYDWCLQNGDRGQRILTEFNEGGNFPITAKDISYASNMKFKFKCLKCGKTSTQIVHNKTTSNNKCKYCAGQSGEISLYDWCLKNGAYGKQLLEEYNNGNNELPADKILYGSNKYANFRCKKCGSINKQIIENKTISKKGCPVCNTHDTSFGEQLIYLWLQSQNIEVHNRYNFRTNFGNKELDIYIPALKLVIEHQSNLHNRVEKQFEDDRAELVVQNIGLNLLEICQTDSNYQRTENRFCITYKYRHEDQMIQKLSTWLFDNYNIKTNPTYNRDLEDRAYLNSCKVKYKNSLVYKKPYFLNEWNYKLNGLVTPDKVSVNSTRKYYWTCPICGCNYPATPDSRNRGSACPNYKQHKFIKR
jgi:hypothetical protein